MTNRTAWKTEDLPEEWIKAIACAEMPAEYAHLDALLDPAQHAQPSEPMADKGECQVCRR